MPGYADLERARAILNLGAAPVEEADAATARLTALNDALSLVFETKVGRSWSETPATATVKAIRARSSPSGVLELPPPGIWSLVSLTVGPTWDGAAWIGGDVADLAFVVPVWQTPDGAYQGVQISGSTSWPWAAGAWYAGVWFGTVRVEAIWADQAGAVPPDVVEAMTFIVAEEYKQERASPESLIGPDGMAVSSRNPWNYERVKGVIARHRVPERITV